MKVNVYVAIDWMKNHPNQKLFDHLDNCYKYNTDSFVFEYKEKDGLVFDINTYKEDEFEKEFLYTKFEII